VGIDELRKKINRNRSLASRQICTSNLMNENMSDGLVLKFSL
jgi:hypothetical protein